MQLEQDYLNLLTKIINKGIYQPNRTGIGTYVIPRALIEHNMADGFPLLTTKKMGIKSISAELEFFIKGYTDKQWLKDRNCFIWNEWCNPKNIPDNLSSDERKEYQLSNNDLGKVYGYQWRNFNSSGYDQLQKTINSLKTDPYNRRQVVTAWNPMELDEMALPPCHMMWKTDVIDGYLNLTWVQRSVDTFLGLPYNIASYALLLKLLALESNLKEGTLGGMLMNVHIYENHIPQCHEQISRTPYELPDLVIPDFNGIFDWTYDKVKLIDYKSHPSIKGDIAI